MLIAKAGEEIRDADGDLVATLAVDIHVGQVCLASQWILPNGKHPSPTDTVPEAIRDFVRSKGVEWP